MAEFVQNRIEEMLPELEQMKRVELFTKKEIGIILKKRTAFEYKLQRRRKQKEDILQYVQYEINVLTLVKKRREKTGYTFKRLEIDVSIIQRIHKLFRLGCYRFQDDVSMWLSHIAFCKKMNEKASVSRLYIRMLQVHTRKPDLWIQATKWEFEVIVSIENARRLMQRGLRFNPASKELWLEYYRLELMYTDKVRKRLKVVGGIIQDGQVDEDGNMINDPVLQSTLADIIYKQGKLAIPDDVEFCLSFVSICHLFRDFTKNHEDQMYSGMKQSFPHSELMWDGLAKREMLAIEELPADNMTDLEYKECVEQIERKCFLVYEKALKAVNTERMWSLCLNACLNCLHSKEALKHTLSVFERGSIAGYISEELYIEWTNLLVKSSDISKALEVCNQGVEKYQSMLLWKRLLEMKIKCSKDEEIYKSFQTALHVVKPESSKPLWDLALEWSFTLKNSDITEALLQAGILCDCKDVAIKMKEYYLDWAALNSGSVNLRDLYQRLSSSSPLSPEFFRKYIQMENTKETPKIKVQRKAFEDGLREFGHKNIEMWLDYILLELNHPKGRPENGSSIHYRAVKTLDSDLTERFVTAYTLLNTDNR